MLLMRSLREYKSKKKKKRGDKNLATNQNKVQVECELPTNSPTPSTRSLEGVRVARSQLSNRTRVDEKQITDKEKRKAQLKFFTKYTTWTQACHEPISMQLQMQVSTQS